MEDYFTAASIIVISNHCRQSGLALETAWNTQRWDHRVTVPGIIETDAYHMWQYFHPNGKEYSHAQFTGEVTYHLLTKPEEELEGSNHESSFNSANEEAQQGPKHDIKPLQSLSIYSMEGKRGLRCCCECGCLAAYYCTLCSDVTNGKIVTIRGLQSRRGSLCLMTHTSHLVS